jgi:hypothetical protein
LNMPFPFNYLSQEKQAEGLVAAWWVLSNPQKFGGKEGQAALEQIAKQGIAEGNMQGAMASLMSKDPVLRQQFAASAMDGYLTGTQTEGLTNDVSRTEGAIMFDAFLGQIQDPAMRQERVATGMPLYSWGQIKKLPNIQKEVAANPELVKRAVEKAAAELVDEADKIDVEFKPNAFNPITDKGTGNDKPTRMGLQSGNQITTDRQAAVMKLNENYRFIAGAFGPAGAEYFKEYMGWNVVAKPKTDGTKPKTPSVQE